MKKKIIKSYSDEIKALQKQFEQTPDLSLADKFRIVEREDIDNLSKGRLKAKLLSSEIESLSNQMKELRGVTAGADEFAPIILEPARSH